MLWDAVLLIKERIEIRSDVNTWAVVYLVFVPLHGTQVAMRTLFENITVSKIGLVCIQSIVNSIIDSLYIWMKISIYKNDFLEQKIKPIINFWGEIIGDNI